MNFRTAGILAAMSAAIAAIVWGGGAASAVGTDDYRSGLTSAGYSVAFGTAPVAHPTLKVSGTTMTIEKGRKGATVELLDYAGNRDALKTDWNAVDGKSPAPRVATTDFAGRVLYWNNDSVLAVSFAEPNFREAAQVAADVFLGVRGTGGAGVTPATAPAGSASGTKLPATGSGSGAQAGVLDWLLVVALVGGAGCAIICVGSAIKSGRR